LEPDEEPGRRPPAAAEPAPAQPAARSEPLAPPAAATTPATEAAAELPGPPLAAGEYFCTAASLLAFLGSVAGSRLSSEATLRRAADGGWWTAVPVPGERTAPLIAASGGRPFALLNDRWVGVTASGDLPGDLAAAPTIDPTAWSETELAELVGQSVLQQGHYLGAPALDLLVPGSLGRWVLNRALALNLTVEITPAVRSPLDGQGAESGALLFSIRAPRHVIPRSLVSAPVKLPYVIAGEAVESERGQVLVDVRCRLPLPAPILADMMPAEETWALGPRETGHWRVRRLGEAVDGASLLSVWDVPVAAPQLAAAPAVLPTGAEIRLMPRPRAAGRVDAVLLDDQELAWIAPYLAGRPIGELSFLIPGPGRHLLTAPGGLPGGSVPFGLPLTHAGPAGLYIEMGWDFYPALTDGARLSRFELSAETAVAVTRSGAFRFRSADMTPAWTLWVGPAPQVQTGILDKGRALLGQISVAYRLAEQRALQAGQQRPARRPKVAAPEDRPRLLQEAQQAEIAGDLLVAAEKLEQAGYPGQAGRLCERAARR
jgi:hypothetical protein